METIQTEQLTITEAQEILGVPPIDMIALSQGYSCLIEDAINEKKFTFEYQKTLSSAYRKLAEGICEFQIKKYGKFKIMVDFSSLNKVVVFPKQYMGGVVTCKACSGIGERIKFHRKPIKVKCSKCKSQSYVLNGEEIIVDDDLIFVNGVNKTDELKYKKLIGLVVEDCLSCKGKGRYIDDLEADLRVNVICITCKGNKYHLDSKKTQILIKCKSCDGNKQMELPVISPNVDTTTRCRVCSGMGFVQPKRTPVKPKPKRSLVKPRPKRRPGNPVLTNILAAKIKTM